VIVSDCSGYTSMAEEFAGTDYAPARLSYFGGVFLKEYTAALSKHTPEEWAAFERWEMHQCLEREVGELKRALWCNEMDGEHGIIREAVHVQVVAQRIMDEMLRRHR